MPIEAIFRDVKFPAGEPFRERRLPFQDRLPALLPDQFARLARPEFFRAVDRFPIHPSILFEAFDSGVFRKLPGWFKNPILDQMRLDVFGHGKGEASNLAAALNGKPARLL
jgi:hypothetical protein